MGRFSPSINECRLSSGKIVIPNATVEKGVGCFTILSFPARLPSKWFDNKWETNFGVKSSLHRSQGTENFHMLVIISREEEKEQFWWLDVCGPAFYLFVSSFHGQREERGN